MIRSTAVYLFVGIYLLVMTPVALLWIRFGRDPRLAYRLARFCLRVAGYMAGIRVTCRGAGKILPGQNYVFLSNHQGNIDGPILIHTIPRDMRALIKRELMSLPFLSFLFRRLHFIPIDRADPRRARSGIDRGTELLRQGYSFFAFPEGTRSRNGLLGPFKKGVFIMALKAGTPIVPISIVGTSAIQPPGSYSIRPGSVHIHIHDPITTEGMTWEDRNLLVERTRTAIASSLPVPAGGQGGE
jgi:1-acyl-sn-glycerol-3-phosphate acyltransferase